MRLMICAGATGGGVYPALAVWQALAEEPIDVLWVGTRGGMEADLVARAGVAYEAVPAAGVHGVGWRRLPGNLWRLGRGYFAARRLLRRFDPDVLFFTGGYVAVPVGMAGRRVPTLLYVPDIEPALALKTLARFADRIALTTEASKGYFSPKKAITVTGYPTRPDLKSWDRGEAFRAFGLSPDKPILLVTGGSLGARRINQALVNALPELLKEMQIIHVVGNATWPEFQGAAAELPTELAANYRPYPYLHEEMGAAYTIADLVISRAGASVLGEYPLFGLPAILVPYPHAWRYQKVNAEYLAQHGAAVVLPEQDLTQHLVTTIIDLMSDTDKRTRMKEAMGALARPQAARQIADILLEMGASPNRKGVN